MPDLNKQTLINLLIDSPLREPIKINLIDIVNNTKDEDLSKTYSTILKEIEIYTKATNRRLKLADEITAKLAQGKPQDTTTPKPPTPPKPDADMPTPPPPAPQPEEEKGPELPPPTQAPTDPMMPPKMQEEPKPMEQGEQDMKPPSEEASSQDVPQPPQSMTEKPSTPPSTPQDQSNGEMGGSPEDEAALQEIQQELDSLKNSASADAGTQTTESSTPPQE